MNEIYGTLDLEPILPRYTVIVKTASEWDNSIINTLYLTFMLYYRGKFH